MKNRLSSSHLRRWPLLPAFFVLACSIHSAQADEPTVPCRRMHRITQCVAVPLASAEEDSVAKQFLLPPDSLSKLYVLRPATTAPKTKSALHLDGKPIVELAPLTYAVIEAAPGVHRLTVHADHDVNIDLNLEPGKIRYVENQYPLLFFTVSGELSLISEQSAQASISQLKLVKSVTENK